MRISSDSARRRNRDRSSLTSARAAWRTGRPVLGEPARRFGFRDDREDLDSLPRDVIRHPHFPNPKTIPRLTQATKALDPALAYSGWLVPQVPFEGVPDFGPMVSLERPEGLRRLRRQDDLVPHSSQNIARLDSWSIRPLRSDGSAGRWALARMKPARGLMPARSNGLLDRSGFTRRMLIHVEGRLAALTSFNWRR